MEEYGLTNVIKVRFVKNCEATGREYTYRSPSPVKTGDIVDVETDRGIITAQVSRVNVPETEIARFGNKAKSITGLTTCRCEECRFLGRDDGHGNRICLRRLSAFPIVGGVTTADNLSCKGSFYQKEQVSPSAATMLVERSDGQQELFMPAPARTPWD